MTGKQLKNSILQWAIQGKLVPQDPNNEPASVLLERIRAEKARLVKEGKIKKDKNESIIFRGDDNSHYEKFLATGEVKCIDDEIPFEIPEGWEWTRLRNIVFSHGQKVPSAKFSYIDIGSIDNKNQCLNTTENIIEPQNAPSRARRIVESGDILYSTVRPYLHNMCIVDKPFSYTPIASTGLAVLACHTGICNRFLFIYLQSPQFDLYANDGDNAKGVAYPAINDEKLYAAFVPVPPFPEQQRIISKIQNLTFPIDRYGKSQEALDQLNTNISVLLKKSILQEAIQGKLVPQDPSDEPASELLKRIREEKLRLVKEGKLKKKDITDSVIFKGDDNRHYEKIGNAVTCIENEIPFEIPDSWSWVRLRNLCSIMTGATFRKEDARHDEQGIRVLRGGNVLPFEIRLKGDDIFLSPDCIKHDILLKQNDLITPAVTSLENICKMARIEKDMPTTTVGGFVFILRPYYDSDSISIYLLEVLSSPALIEFVKSITNKSGQAFYNIGKERLGSALIPLPPIKEQKRINDRIELLWNNLR